MSKIVIAKNNTITDKKIEDLGITIDASSSRNLSTNFDLEAIYTSLDLKSLVSLGEIVINNGTSDLDIPSALEYIDFITKEVVGPHFLKDHLDTALTTPEIGDFICYDSTEGWKPKKLNPQTSTPPEDGSNNLWISETDRMPFFWDIAREQWLTINRSYLTFAKRDKADGIYLPIDGEGSIDFYYLPRAACITSIYCISKGGEITKNFSIRNDVTELYNFSYNSSLIWVNSNLEINLDPGALLRVRVSDVGDFVKDTVMQLEIAWRYVAP